MSKLLVLLLLPSAAAAAGSVVSGSSAPVHLIASDKGTAKLLLNPSTGASEAALTLLELKPGAEVPEHVHDASAEILYIQSGSVEMTIDGKLLTAKAGDAVHIPAGIRHSARAKGKLQAVQLYVGPGPEQRFLQGKKLR